MYALLNGIYKLVICCAIKPELIKINILVRWLPKTSRYARIGYSTEV